MYKKNSNIKKPKKPMNKGFISKKALKTKEKQNVLKLPFATIGPGESIYWEEQRNLNDTEYRRISTFPSDFDFCNAKVRYVCGMSVPPMMTAKIVEQIKTQWLNSSLNKL